MENGERGSEDSEEAADTDSSKGSLREYRNTNAIMKCYATPSTNTRIDNQKEIKLL